MYLVARIRVFMLPLRCCIFRGEHRRSRSTGFVPVAFFRGDHLIAAEWRNNAIASLSGLRQLWAFLSTAGDLSGGQGRTGSLQGPTYKRGVYPAFFLSPDHPSIHREAHRS